MQEEEEVPQDPQYYVPTLPVGVRLIQNRPAGARMKLVVRRSMATKDYRRLRREVTALGDGSVSFSAPRERYGYPYYKVIQASRVEDLYAFPFPILEKEVVVCISQKIPPDVYHEIAKEAELLKFLVASYPEYPLHQWGTAGHPQYLLPGLSFGMKAFVFGGWIAATGVGLLLLLLCTSKSPPANPCNPIAFCKSVPWKVLKPGIRFLLKIILKILEN